MERSVRYVRKEGFRAHGPRKSQDIAGDGVKHLENDAEMSYEIVQGREAPEARDVLRFKKPFHR